MTHPQTHGTLAYDTRSDGRYLVLFGFGTGIFVSFYFPLHSSGLLVYALSKRSVGTRNYISDHVSVLGFACVCL
jgi:hypothetical protein